MSADGPAQPPSGSPEPIAAGQGADLARSALEQARVAARDRERTNARGVAARRRRAGKAPAALPGSAQADPVAFGVAISALVEARGWALDAAVAAVTARWAELVGPDIAAHCHPVTLRDRVLTVEAESSAWATQLRLLSATVQARISAGVGAGVVDRLIVHGPARPSWKRGPWSAPGRGPRDTYG